VVSRLNLEDIPEPLRPFAALVEKWMLTDESKSERLQRAEGDEAAMEELELAAQRWSLEHRVAFQDWRESEDHPSAASRLYDYFLSFLVELEIGPDERPSDWVGMWIEWLSAFGSQLKAARRWQAAESLADYGPNGMRAIPALREALVDEHLLVRVWAHYALARLDGDLQWHRTAIELIGQIHGPDDPHVSGAVRRALQRLRWTGAQHDQGAFCRFSRRGDLENMRRLLPQVDINGCDHNAHTPLQHAVGSQQAAAVEFLLIHGADPNLTTPSADTPLHWVAVRRLGGPIIRLLAEHGADVNARNEQGQTPLDRALDFGRTANAGILRELGGMESVSGERP